MRVHLGSDHAGYDLKGALVSWLTQHGHDPVDHGPPTCDESDDYPPFVMRAATAVMEHAGSLGVVIGGSGNGEQIAANKVRGVRAALVWSEETARLAREHNDANVISIGARMHAVATAIRFVQVFLSTPYSGDPRHTRRIEMIRHYEESGRLSSPG